MKRLIFAGCLAIAQIPNLSAQARYCEAVFDEVSVTTDVQYGINATVVALSAFGEAVPQPLLLDFYEPAGDTLEARPLVLVLSGGNFLPPPLNGACGPNHRDSVVVELCTRLAKMGYTAAAVSYRLGWNPVAPNETERFFTLVNAWYRAMQDTRTAVRFFKKTFAEDDNFFGVDTARIAVWGFNTGTAGALSAAYANSYADWVHPSLITVAGPMVAEFVNGDIAGTSVGVVPPGYVLYPAGDTLCYPNWTGYSSRFQLVVSAAGQTPGVPWVGLGEVPGVFFHAPNDALAICGDGLWGFPPFFSLFPLSGGCSLAAQLQDFGCNQIFVDAGFTDPITAQANLYNGGLEGFYPFIGLPLDDAHPWIWSAPCAANPNPNTDAAMSRRYVDSMIAYFAPRGVVALDLTRAACPGAGSSVEAPRQADAPSISPNPAGDFVVLREADAPAEALRIFDASGRLFFSWKKETPGDFLPEKIPVNDWPSGLYVAQLRTKTGLGVGKFIKE